MNEANQKMLESAKENFENNKNKPPNQQLANNVKNSKDMIEIGVGSLIGMLKGSLIHLLTVVLGFLTCTTGFILNVVDAAINRQISKRNIINAAANVLCIVVVIPGLTFIAIFKGATEIFNFLPF